jgi:hypothetical protein
LTVSNKKDYTRGWRSGLYSTGMALDNADARGEPEAWYDGYMDAAAGRAKWHIPNCPAHHNHDGGCGQA